MNKIVEALFSGIVGFIVGFLLIMIILTIFIGSDYLTLFLFGALDSFYFNVTNFMHSVRTAIMVGMLFAIIAFLGTLFFDD